MQDGPAEAPYIVLCEGNAERSFLNRLLRLRWGATSEFSVRCTHTQADPDRCAGRSGLKDTLLALDAVKAFHPRLVRGIAIVFDGDNDRDGRFGEIMEAMRESKLKYPRPNNPLEIAPGDPSVGVYLHPVHLDELIFEALRESHQDLIAPVNAFELATLHRTEKWKYGAKSKMRLRAMIAASWERDPSGALAHFLETSDSPVDFKHSCFDALMAFLDDFRAKA